jgi:hypothetical protein
MNFFSLARRFDSRPMFSDVAFQENYVKANNMVASIWSLVSIQDVGLSDKQGEDLLELTKSNIIVEHRTKMALGGVKTFDDIRHVINRNGTAQSTVKQRTPEWFEANGEYQEWIAII